MSNTPQSIHSFLAEPYPLTKEQIDFYQQNRYIKLKQVLNNEAIHYFNAAISKKVSEMNSVTASLADIDTYGKAFLQLFNLWREDAN